MAKLQQGLRQVPRIFKYLLILAVIAVISLLFPDNLRFKYQFEPGQTWGYETLKAPFDIPIRKTEAELLEERMELEAAFSPYYIQQNDSAIVQLQAYDSAFDKQLEEVQQSGQFLDVQQHEIEYAQTGRDYLDRVLERGLVEPEPKHLEEGADFQVHLIRGNIKERRFLRSLTTVEEAIGQLSDSLPAMQLKEADFLYPILNEVVAPTIFYSDSLTQLFREQLFQQAPSTRGVVNKGEVIVRRGEVVTDSTYQKLASFREKYEREVSASRIYWMVYLGYLLLTTLIIGVFVLYLQRYAPTVFNRFGRLLFVLMWVVLYSYLVFAVENADILNPYLIPFCIVPIVIKTFYNPRLALFTHLVVVLIASFLSNMGYEFTFLQVLAGIVVLLSEVDTRDWSRFFYSMLYIFLAYSLGFFGLSLIQEGDLNEIDWSVYTWLALNVFLTLLAYPLIPLLGRLFGFTSSISLVELSDMNRPLLQQLALKAPGTMQHSLQVANLSEAAAREIGADHLLVKVAALYHDIGKTKHPEFFIENQDGNNPHEGLPPEESARIIIEHVTNGFEMARKVRLPRVLIDFILTHHGTTRVEYFYRQYEEAQATPVGSDATFRYPGPRPRSREETILMVADSIEAACKSLKNPTAKELTDFIDKIIAGKIAQGQFQDSDMSFSELECCVAVFKSVMKSVYHVRIEYPKES